jgi:hypothetical protein
MDGAVGYSDACVEQSEVVVNLGDRPNSAAWVFTGGFLFDGDGGGESFDAVDVWFVHEPEELSCIGGKGFDVASLSFCVEGVECKGGFPGAGDPGDDDEFVSGELYGDVFQVVFSCSFDDDVFHWKPPLKRASIYTNIYLLFEANDQELPRPVFRQALPPIQGFRKGHRNYSTTDNHPRKKIKEERKGYRSLDLQIPNIPKNEEDQTND